MSRRQPYLYPESGIREPIEEANRPFDTVLARPAAGHGDPALIGIIQTGEGRTLVETVRFRNAHPTTYEVEEYEHGALTGDPKFAILSENARALAEVRARFGPGLERHLADHPDAEADYIGLLEPQPEPQRFPQVQPRIGSTMSRYTFRGIGITLRWLENEPGSLAELIIDERGEAELHVARFVGGEPTSYSEEHTEQGRWQPREHHDGAASIEAIGTRFASRLTSFTNHNRHLWVPTYARFHAIMDRRFD